MVCDLTRELRSHAPLEILRQAALATDWGAAKRACCHSGLLDSIGRVGLELIIAAVWATDADGVCAAIAKIEAADTQEDKALPS